MDEHRVWGWKIVNYGKYRSIRSEDDRREQNRLAQERWRQKNKQSKPSSAQAEGEAINSKSKPKDDGPLRGIELEKRRAMLVEQSIAKTASRKPYRAF